MLRILSSGSDVISGISVGLSKGAFKGPLRKDGFWVVSLRLEARKATSRQSVSLASGMYEAGGSALENL